MFNKLKIFVIALASMLALLVFNPGIAQAHHVGPFVYNASHPYDPDVRVSYIIHNSSGVNGFGYTWVEPGGFSPRAATSVKVPNTSGVLWRVRIQSIVTGAIYSSECNESIQIGNGDGTGNSAKVLDVIPCSL